MPQRMYRFSLEWHAKALRKQLNLKNPHALADMAKAHDWKIKRIPEIVSAVDTTIAMEEWDWLASNNKRAYFFKDADLARKVMNGIHRITDPSMLYECPESFLLSLPEELDVNPGGSGLLVSFMDYKYRSGKLAESFFSAMGRETPETSNDKAIDIMLTVNYLAPNDSKSDMAWTCLSLPLEWITDIVRMSEESEYCAFMSDRTRMQDNNYAVPLTHDEQVKQFYVFKLVCGFLLFRKALPERFINGTPGEGNPLYATKTSARAHFQTLLPPVAKSDRSTSVTHYRSWHFRQLMNERYYRGEHKNKKLGSRFVFVSDSVVGRDIEALTVI